MASDLAGDRVREREELHRLGRSQMEERTPASVAQDQPGGRRTRMRIRREKRLARGLGWFSIGLGLVETLAPQRLAEFFGIRNRTGLLRFAGLREMATGVGILQGRRPAGWLWARVAGDGMDLALLASGMLSPGTRKGRLAAATAAVAGVTALDLLASRRLSRSGEAAAPRIIDVQASIVINRPPEDVYRFWRSFENLPRFMKHVESVRAIGQERSHWIATGPAGWRVEWDAETTADEPNRRIAWRSLEGSVMETRGTVSFEAAPGDRGTIVRIQMQYSPPGGSIAALGAWLFGKEPGQQLPEDLRRLRQLLETGEILTIEGQPAGRTSSTSWKYDRTGRTEERKVNV